MTDLLSNLYEARDELDEAQSKANLGGSLMISDIIDDLDSLIYRIEENQDHE